MIKKASAPDLGAALARARAVSAKLGAATDKLNESLLQIESELAALNLGVTAFVVIRTEVDEHSGSVFEASLRFGKENREWKLMYDTCVNDEPESFDSAPVVNTSRETRMAIVEHLPALIQALVETAEKQISEVQAKAEETAKLAALVRAGETRP